MNRWHYHNVWGNMQASHGSQYTVSFPTPHPAPVPCLTSTFEMNFCSYQTRLTLITGAPQDFLLWNCIPSIPQPFWRKESHSSNPLLLFCKKQCAAAYCHLCPLNDQHHAVENPVRAPAGHTGTMKYDPSFGSDGGKKT